MTSVRAYSAAIPKMAPPWPELAGMIDLKLSSSSPYTRGRTSARISDRRKSHGPCLNDGLVHVRQGEGIKLWSTEYRVSPCPDIRFS